MTMMQKLFSFQGRLRRRDYWLFGLLIAVINFGLIVTIRFGLGVGWTVHWFPLITLAMLWPSLAIGAKRIHDRGKSAWLLVAGWGPILIFKLKPVIDYPPPLYLLISAAIVAVGIWFFIDFGLLDGAPGPNRYGPSPKDGNGQADGPGGSVAA